MFKLFFTAGRATIVIALMTGLAFPLFVTALAQLFFPAEANGSLIRNASGLVIGSALIGQNFSRADYFHPRPSAAGAAGYAGEASSGTNLGPTSARLINGVVDDPATKDVNESFEGVRQLASRYRQENFLDQNQAVPVDAVTRSASGLDPDISPANAQLQIRRVARARGLSEITLANLVKSHTQNRLFGILGEPCVRVLPLNLALDALASAPEKLSQKR